jgi:hypothetical protein
VETAASRNPLRDRATGDDQDDVDDDVGASVAGDLSGEAREIVGEVDGAS